ncbi:MULTISPECIES: phosphoglycerate dehydrogenase [Dehalobacter]|jgi:D-3-phosphoglycerate dehydrogenase|uniref:D-3-phosphoglycerate dehydrogenase n=2 Tax=Dehalobacter restrictus TaxID=55583 RepID=A0A857DFX1_9FIRM|nr:MULTISPECIES: phosphoglycerate dehydrogenase [Dehalobacter]AHF09592.1 3-phosphoglycerate dehydrogenase [Dehalobacter restrictus DSM 9455]MCG1026582.1 phosphoglycerate dehydrogenase [Dehalobacter sp.]MDJ0304371.1 phosphoglycerate dehydrogenase [Dehalobacter sp.]OCZ54932.1 phosphoglycerate dehydrogenase [Dehalobacter sp. TeCB1]QHA00184.1 phosphoglycerate dehydrogenase [Dehalobacter restrictus]
MKILVNNKVAEAGIQLLREEHDVDTYCTLSQEELIKMIPKYDALVIRGDTIVSSEVIEAGRNLKVIGRAGLEVEHIDIQAATKQGIVVLNAPQGNSASSIEYTIGMILALARRIPQAYSSVKRGEWQRQKFLGMELKEKVLGIIGLGRVGMGVAKRAKAFDMKVIAYDPFLSDDKGRELGIELVDLDEILSKADYLTLHIPATVDTRNLLNKDAFSKMKKGIKIINCARGGIIDEEALIWALQEEIVSGAALDAFAEEPLQPDHPLVKMENVVCTPRIASRTQEAENEVAVCAARGVLAALRSEPVSTSLNIPPVSRDVMNMIKPYLHLMQKMCVLAVKLTEGRIKNIEVRYNGDISTADTKMLTLAAIKEVLNPILQEEVNIVNAPEVAKERGITVKEIKSKEAQSFVDLISITVKTDLTEHKVASTLFGKSEQRIVEIDDFRVEIDPSGWFLLISHEDYPGMIGKVGTVLGEHNINITSMQVGKISSMSRNIMIVGIQTEADSEVIGKLKEIKGTENVEEIFFNKYLS